MGVRWVRTTGEWKDHSGSGSSTSNQLFLVHGISPEDPKGLIFVGLASVDTRSRVVGEGSIGITSVKSTRRQVLFGNASFVSTKDRWMMFPPHGLGGTCFSLELFFDIGLKVHDGRRRIQRLRVNLNHDFVGASSRMVFGTGVGNGKDKGGQTHDHGVLGEQGGDSQCGRSRGSSTSTTTTITNVVFLARRSSGDGNHTGSNLHFGFVIVTFEDDLVALPSETFHRFCSKSHEFDLSSS
mmetsp:Transcript_27954/g.39488  ORF Transcript_27954/g.39488 Transcript_27954/m.39488 type:complete len:239 (+) Transcript_27954:1562-2278(+)